jgi:FkbM family methyltransferase
MYYSQAKQDEILDKEVFKGYKRGIFVEIGAWDGVCFSNTLFFEKERNWRGINIEPLPDKYADLVKNRPTAINLNVAVNDVEEETDFLAISGDTGMLSGIRTNYDDRHVARIERETAELKTTASTLRIQTRRIDSIFREYNVRRVHYLSIDVEGSEMNIIRSIDFDFTYIDVIGFENNYTDKTLPIITYLEGKGYTKLPFQSGDVFMIRANSPFATIPRHNRVFNFIRN